MYVAIYNQANSESNENDSQTITLKRIAESKGWYVKRTFIENTAPNSISDSHGEFESLVEYAEKTQVDVIMVWEMSILGRRVEDILSTIELLHAKGIALYIQQFNLLTLENGKENSMTKIILKAMSVGASIERNQRLSKQLQGIKRARMNGAYPGRKPGAKTKPETLLKKYIPIIELIDKNELSVRAIARATNYSINTVRKVKALKS